MKFLLGWRSIELRENVKNEQAEVQLQVRSFAVVAAFSLGNCLFYEGI